jgi:FdhD protein
VLTSGCGGGASFIEQRTSLDKLESQLKVSGEELLILMKQLYQKAEMHQQGGGVHASALCDSQNIIVLSEDIGRHNTLDRIKGHCLFTGIPTKDRILVTTGRISSEMLLKAARMEVPVIASRSAPLTRAATLGEKLGITVIGYARANRLEVYSHSERLSGCFSEAVKS